MPEYVYALHDFTPEHDDEIAFRAGERIEVIERDDLYGDGWWQGRNLQGKVGLFPQTYAAATGPATNVSVPQVVASTPAPLQTLKEESDADSLASAPPENPKTESNGVMKATMTDVQKAIEQLGNRNDQDGGASFTFASYREGDNTDRETDRETDTETDKDGDGETWHKGARHNLAEKARAAVQQEKMQSSRATQPPIDVEVSDESDVDDDHPISPISRDHPNITEEEEDELDHTAPLLLPSANKTPGISDGPSTLAVPSQELEVKAIPVNLAPSPAKSESQVPTARQDYFPILPEQSVPETPKEQTTAVSSASLTSPWSPSSINAAEPKPFFQTPVYDSDVPPPSAISPSQSSQPPNSPSALLKLIPRGPPSEWTVEEVVDWAKSKNFDNSICAKFVEHEITGDVLLDLDATLLKTELEIHAFGKRMKIAHAIDELRRPPSIISSDHRSAPSHSISHSQSLPGSAHQSLTSTLAYQTTSAAGQIFSPESPPHTGDIAGTPVSVPQYRRESDPGSIAVSITEMDQNSRIHSSPGVGLGLPISNGSLEPDKSKKNKPSHLTLSSPSDSSLKVKAVGGLIPEESDDIRASEDKAALSESETAHGSDTRSKRRRLFGRSTGSTASSHEVRDSSSHNSKETATPLSSLPGSPSMVKNGVNDDSSVRQARPPKRSMDAGKPADRLSLFGSSFVGSIGKGRKPPPRYSSYVAEDAPVEKPRGLTRLMGSHGSKKSGRPSTADSSSRKNSAGSFGFLDQGDKEKIKGKEKEEEEENVQKDREDEKPKNKEKDKDKPKEKETAQLRKRTVSQTKDSEKSANAKGSVVLRPGESALDQIGSPDHNGWMRKKGEQFNSWKLRYFVLKGQHLYYLRSNSKTETKIKGYINITGYKVIVDENVDPGRYGFRLIHDTDKTHYLSSEEQTTVREWMKALMKATIGRDYTKPVISSANVPTIPLSVAQTMIPAPRPPSPTARDATQKALRRENPNQLSSRDARVLMGLPSPENDETERGRLESFFTVDTVPFTVTVDEPPVKSAPTPPRPSKERRVSSHFTRVEAPSVTYHMDADLMKWANSLLPESLRLRDTSGTYSGLALFRLAESIKGVPVDPPVQDSAFPTSASDDRLDGLFKLFDFFLDNDIKMGTVSINDVRQGNAEKIEQLVRSLKTWEDKRKAITLSIGKGGAYAGPFMAIEKDPPSWKLE